MTVAAMQMADMKVWQIYRVWSTDWFSDSNRETGKLIAWLDSVRDRIAKNLAHKPAQKQNQPMQLSEVQFAPESQPQDASAILAQPDLSAGEAIGDIEINQPREPKGRKLRPLGDIEPYESVRGSLYELWRAEVFLGEVEVIRHATGTARLYGDGLKTSLPEYEGRVELTGEAFVSFDLYAAMRQVAARATRKTDN